jgi:hypothetical protein
MLVTVALTLGACSEGHGPLVSGSEEPPPAILTGTILDCMETFDGTAVRIVVGSPGATDGGFGASEDGYIATSTSVSNGGQGLRQVATSAPGRGAGVVTGAPIPFVLQDVQRPVLRIVAKAPQLGLAPGGSFDAASVEELSGQRRSGGGVTVTVDRLSVTRAAVLIRLVLSPPPDEMADRLNYVVRGLEGLRLSIGDRRLADPAVSSSLDRGSTDEIRLSVTFMTDVPPRSSEEATLAWDGYTVIWQGELIAEPRPASGCR